MTILRVAVPVEILDACKAGNRRLQKSLRMSRYKDWDQRADSLIDTTETQPTSFPRQRPLSFSLGPGQQFEVSADRQSTKKDYLPADLPPSAINLEEIIDCGRVTIEHRDVYGRGGVTSLDFSVQVISSLYSDDVEVLTVGGTTEFPGVNEPLGIFKSLARLERKVDSRIRTRKRRIRQKLGA